MEYVLIGNEKIAFKQMGEAKSAYTLIFIHGATMTGKGMVPLAKHFLKYNCIIVDLPGHGGSTGETKKTIEEFAECIDLFLQELLHTQRISKHLTLIGYSLGGVIAYELALKKRDEYKRMIILSSGANVSKYAPLIDQIKQIPVESFNLGLFFEHAFGTNTTEKQKKLIIDILTKTKVDDSIGYSDLLCATTYNKIDKASEVLIPTLIFAGGEDEVILAGCDIDLWKQLKNASIAIVPFRGHTALYEEMKYLVSLINDFCEHNQ